LTEATGSLRGHEGLSIFMILHCSVLLRMRNISDKSCRENRNTSYVQ